MRVLLASACGGDEPGGNSGEAATGTAARHLPTVRDSLGVTIVENTAPRWRPGGGWRMGRLLTSVGEAEGDPPYQLYYVFDAVRQSDGTVAVDNDGTSEIRFFDRDGVFVRSVGGPDGGPGEFRGTFAIRGLARLPGDTLVAFDIYAQAVSIFAPDGRFVRSGRLQGPDGQHFFSGIFEDGSLLLYIFHHPPDPLQEGVTRTHLEAYHYGSDMGFIESVGRFPGNEQFQAKWGRWGMVSDDPPYGRVATLAAGGDEVYVATGDANQFAIYDRSGALRTLVRRMIPKRPMTPELIERFKASRDTIQYPGDSKGRIRRMYEALPFPDSVPPYGKMVLDAERDVWLEEPRLSDDAPNAWAVFDPNGVWLGAVSLPPALQVYEIGADDVLGKLTDELGVERVQVHELVKP